MYMLHLSLLTAIPLSFPIFASASTYVEKQGKKVQKIAKSIVDAVGIEPTTFHKYAQLCYAKRKSYP